MLLERCSAPSARRYAHCRCWACKAAQTAYKRSQRLAAGTGDHVCPFCSQRFETLQGMRVHRGRRHMAQVVA